ncbi:MAG: hypothetical protein V3R77_07630 [Candidatus Binatia bacterium]
MKAAGSSLLEAIAAVGLGSLLAAAGVLGVRDALFTLRSISSREAALTSARNLIEAARAATCGDARAPTPCPTGLRCTLHRDTLVPATTATLAIVRLRAEVTPVGGDAAERDAPLTLSTAVRVPRGCG